MFIPPGESVWGNLDVRELSGWDRPMNKTDIREAKEMSKINGKICLLGWGIQRGAEVLDYLIEQKKTSN